jgi:hypothetical protein
MKFTIRTALVVTTISAVLLTIGIGVWQLKEFAEESVLNSYRLVSAGEIFVQFKRSTGYWPPDWDALQHYAAANGSQSYACENFEELKNNIDIDFSLDLTSIDTSNNWSDVNPQIRMFVSKTGQTLGATIDPNELIYSELRRDSEKMRTKP